MKSLSSPRLQGIQRLSNLTAPIMLLTGHEGEVFGTKFSPDGKLLASGGFDRLICEYKAMLEKYFVFHFQLGGLKDG